MRNKMSFKGQNVIAISIIRRLIDNSFGGMTIFFHNLLVSNQECIISSHQLRRWINQQTATGSTCLAQPTGRPLLSHTTTTDQPLLFACQEILCYHKILSSSAKTHAQFYISSPLLLVKGYSYFILNRIMFFIISNSFNNLILDNLFNRNFWKLDD